jgi:hypothetical protein
MQDLGTQWISYACRCFLQFFAWLIYDVVETLQWSASLQEKYCAIACISKTKLRGQSPWANYSDRAAAACWRT